MDEKALEQMDAELRKDFADKKKAILDVIGNHDGPITEEEILMALSGKIDSVSLGIVLALLITEGSIICERNSP
jgi:hypothetical protein